MLRFRENRRNKEGATQSWKDMVTCKFLKLLKIRGNRASSKDNTLAMLEVTKDSKEDVDCVRKTNLSKIRVL